MTAMKEKIMLKMKLNKLISFTESIRITIKFLKNSLRCNKKIKKKIIKKNKKKKTLKVIIHFPHKAYKMKNKS
jgi:hypothetical protein